MRNKLLSLLFAFALVFSLGLINMVSPSAAVASDVATEPTLDTNYTPAFQQYLKDLQSGDTAKYSEVIPSPFAPAATISLFRGFAAAPAVYNPLDSANSYLPAIKDQGSTGCCWTFGAAGLVDIYDSLRNNTPNVYSEEHMRFSSSNKNPAPVDAKYDRGPDDGGNFNLASAYMTNWTGMVLDSAAPFVGALGESWSSAKMNAPVVDRVTGTEAIPTNNQADVKTAIMDYGAVNVIINSSTLQSGSATYNPATNAAYGSDPTLVKPHSVLLVGWDDTFPASNFNASHRPSSPGAWLVRNSWGASLGNAGYYWLSYQDASLNSSSYNVAYYAVTQDRPVKPTETILSDDHMPQEGRLNLIDAQQVYAANTYQQVYAANTYQMAAGSAVSDVMLYSASVGATYSIYIVPAAASGLPQIAPSALKSPLATGMVAHEGYQTITLSSPYKPPTTGKYSVVIAYDLSGVPPTPNSGLSLELGYTFPDYPSAVGTGTSYINPGESSYATAGSGWSDLSTFAKAKSGIYTDETGLRLNMTFGNFCIRAIVQTPAITASMIKLPATSYIYTGSAIKPVPTVTSGAETLVAGKDYTISYGANTAVGTGSVTVTALGNPTNKATVTFAITPATPKLASLANSTTGPLLKWGKAAGAAGYYVYRKNGTGSWAKIGAVASASTVSYTDKTAVSGTAYSYTVSAYAGTGPVLSAYDTVGKTVTYVATPKLTSAVNTTTGVKFTWGKVSGATGYIIYRKTGAGAWTKVKTITTAATVSWTNTGLSSGTTYTYTAKAYKTSAANISSYNSTGKKVVYVATPALSSLANSKSGPVLKWGKVSSASGYLVYRKTTGGWSKIATIKSGSTVSFTDKGATNKKTYAYTVRAYKTSTSYLSAYNTTGKKITVKK